MPPEEKSDNLSVFVKLIPFIKRHSKLVTISIAFTVLIACTDTLNAFVQKNIIDSAIGCKTTLLVKFMLLLLTLMAANAVGSYIMRTSSGLFCSRIMRDIRDTAVRHIEKMPVSYMENHHSGDMVSRLTNDASAIQNFFEYTFSSMLYNILVFIGALSYMLFINWKLLLASIILVPGGLFLSNLLSKPVSRYMSQMQSLLGDVNSTAQDAIGGIQMVKAFSLKKSMLENYRQSMKKVIAKGFEVDRRNALVTSVRMALRVVPNMSCIVYGGYLATRGYLSPGSLLAFIGLLNYITRPIANMPFMISGYKSAMGAAGHFFEILDLPVERTDGSDFFSDEAETLVECRDIRFGYNENSPVIDNLSFRLMRGKTVALVGPSGSGKSTVLKLIGGFYEPQEGSVEVYGRKLKDWNLSALRGKMSLVSQDTYLFPASVAENISYGHPGASLNEIISAARAANAHDFIMDLPEGYNTAVGERGIKLSGGQKQRLSIARAILKNAPILLLDEPTSALDTQSEALVQEALEKIMRRRTVLVIAHRLSTVKGADEVLVLNKGRIAQRGTHSQLMEEDGLYCQLYLKQFAAGNEMQNTEIKDGAAYE